jgi:hypothetical protein
MPTEAYAVGFQLDDPLSIESQKPKQGYFCIKMNTFQAEIGKKS